jgi:hypothetical protein
MADEPNGTFRQHFWDMLNEKEKLFKGEIERLEGLLDERREQFRIELKRYDQLFVEREKQSKSQAEAEQTARTLFAENMKLDKEHLNKLRTEVITDRAQFVIIETFKAEINAIYVEIKAINEKVDARFKASDNAFTIAHTALTEKLDNAVGALTNKFEPDIRFLRESRAMLEGVATAVKNSASQTSLRFTQIVLVIGLFLSIAGIILHFL